MKKALLLTIVSAMLLFTFTACSSQPEQPVSNNPELEGTQFISAQDAKALIDSGDDVVVIGVLNGTTALVPLSDESSPIDGSYRVWRPDYSGGDSTEAISPNVTGFRLDQASMDVLLSKAGINQDTQIIVYSTGSMHDSTRFGWQLELLGLSPLYLDGGLNAWKAAGFDTGDQTTLVDEEEKGSDVVSEWKVDELGVDIYDVIEAVENPDEWVIIDTRSDGEFNGEETGSSSGAHGTGAISFAVHIEWTQALNEDKTLKSIAELEEIYGDVIDGKKVITFCQSGVRSSHTMIVLREMLGVEEVYNYDGSWLEWSYVASEASTDVDADLKASVLALTDRWTDNNGPI